MDWRILLFSFKGRINRAKYWLTLLITSVGAFVGAMIAAMFSALGDVGAFLLVVVMIAVGVFIVWTGLATGLKRLHDREKSGSWLVLFYVAPSILSAVSSNGNDALSTILAIAGFCISVWGFVELGCLKGTTGPNEYGPDPLPAEATT
jgi:uncharacterized membrane protein YhaH (DUF805 family)